MSLRTQKTTTTTYRTVNVPSSPEPVATKTVVSGGTMLSGGTVVSGGTMLTGQTVVSGGTVSPLPYAQNGSYETVRYLVPVQQAAMQQQQSFYLMPQQSMVQPVMQCVSPVYLQTLPRLSVSSQESDLHYRQRVESTSGKSSVFSQPASPIKSPEPSAEEEEEEEEEEENGEVELEEVEIVNIIQTKAPPPIQNISRTDVKIDVRDTYQPEKLDTRYFGELLADVYRKNCDIHSCISDHVSKIRGQKYQVDLSSSDFKEVEALIPKGATELTKQQIRYLLQTRLTADKSMRLLLSTFNSLREELLHMSADLRRLESEKEALERDLSFKADQARQYDSLLEAVRDNNRQLQASLKETTATQRSLETQLMSTRNTDSSREFKIKELEGKLKALESENNMLRQKLAGQGSSTATLHMKTEELSRQYNEQLSAIRQEKEREIERLKSQITKIRTEVTTTTSSSAEKSLQLKISELLSQLDQRQTIITRQEEEIRKLMQERNDSSKNVTKTIITKKYRNQYPILGLLSDDYQATSPVKEAKTIIIERTGEMIKEEIIITP